MLGQRRRRWTNIKSAFVQHLVFADTTVAHFFIFNQVITRIPVFIHIICASKEQRKLV